MISKWILIQWTRLWYHHYAYQLVSEIFLVFDNDNKAVHIPFSGDHSRIWRAPPLPVHASNKRSGTASAMMDAHRQNVGKIQKILKTVQWRTVRRFVPTERKMSNKRLAFIFDVESNVHVHSLGTYLCSKYGTGNHSPALRYQCH